MHFLLCGACDLKRGEGLLRGICLCGSGWGQGPASSSCLYYLVAFGNSETSPCLKKGARLPKNDCSGELIFFKSVSLFLAESSHEDCKGNTGLNEGAHNLYKQAGYAYLCLPSLLSLLEGINTARWMVAKKRARGEDISCSESLRFMNGEIFLQWSGEAEKWDAGSDL